jgi:DNA-directed RNA polymerase subunit RPC12/RpoP
MPEGPFPIPCESCGRTTITPTAQGTIVDEHELQLAVQCSECGSRWITRAPNTPMAIRRQVDRRGGARRP